VKNRKTKTVIKKERSRRWFLTIWAEHNSLEEIEEKLSMYDAYKGQQEKAPEIGAIHFHVVIEHKNPIAFTTLQRKFPKAHIEPLIDDEAAEDYVEKDETAYPPENPVRFQKGEFAPRRKRKAQNMEIGFNELCEMILDGHRAHDLILEYPKARWFRNKLLDFEQDVRYEEASTKKRKIEVTYIWGITGAGKTYSLREEYKGDAYFVTDYKRDPFGNYRYQDVIVFDEFTGQIPIDYMLLLLDENPVELDSRYQNKWAGYTKAFVVSNTPLESLYRDTQLHEPERWDAFMRRIHNIKHMPTKFDPKLTNQAATQSEQG